MITMTFNGVDLSEYLRITEVIRTIGNHRDISLVDGLQIGASEIAFQVHARIKRGNS